VRAQFAHFMTQWAQHDTVKHIFELIDAANFLGIEPLLTLGLSWMACVIKGESGGTPTPSTLRPMQPRVVLEASC
jgi:hypothetical protein